MLVLVQIAYDIGLCSNGERCNTYSKCSVSTEDPPIEIVYET